MSSSLHANSSAKLSKRNFFSEVVIVVNGVVDVDRPMNDKTGAAAVEVAAAIF